MPPLVSAFLHVDLAARTLQNENMLDSRALFESAVDNLFVSLVLGVLVYSLALVAIVLPPRRASLYEVRLDLVACKDLLGGDEDLAFTVVDTVSQALC